MHKMKIECSAHYESRQACTAPTVSWLQKTVKLCLTPTAATELSLGLCALVTLIEVRTMTEGHRDGRITT